MRAYRMSALGQKQTLGEISGMSAFAGHANMKPASTYNCSAPDDDKFRNVVIAPHYAYSAPGIWCGEWLCELLIIFFKASLIKKLDNYLVNAGLGGIPRRRTSDARFAVLVS